MSAEWFASVDALPAAARALFGADTFSTLWWYRAVERAGLAAGDTARYLVSGTGAGALCLPIRAGPSGFGALTTPYTVSWAPLLPPEADPGALRAARRALGGAVRRHGTARFDCLAQPWAPSLRPAGTASLPFDHFGNWTAEVGEIGWDAYLGARPGALREAIRRKSRALERRQGTPSLDRYGADAAAFLAAYEDVRARSWKTVEPFPDFLSALAEEAAGAGALRLSRLDLDGTCIAAQIWTVHAGTAVLHKLVHDEAQRALSPGTVLTAYTIEALLAEDAPAVLDFGRGDDEYKQLWADRREARFGVVLASPLHPRGALGAARHWAGRGVRGLRRTMPFPSRHVG